MSVEKSPESIEKKRKEVQERIDRQVRRDRILLNNPVIFLGIGLAPLIVAATSGSNALVISVAVLCLLTPTRVLASLLCNFAPARFRGAVYSLSAAIVYIGAYWVMVRVFQSSSLTQIGLYLPLLIVDPIMLKRYERVQNEKAKMAFNKGVITTFGYIIIVMIVGCLREFIGLGTLFGNQIISTAIFPIAVLPSGGFIIVALLMVVWKSFVKNIKNSIVEREVEAWQIH